MKRVSPCSSRDSTHSCPRRSLNAEHDPRKLQSPCALPLPPTSAIFWNGNVSLFSWQCEDICWKFMICPNPNHYNSRVINGSLGEHDFTLNGPIGDSRFCSPDFHPFLWLWGSARVGMRPLLVETGWLSCGVWWCNDVIYSTLKHGHVLIELLSQCFHQPRWSTNRSVRPRRSIGEDYSPKFNPHKLNEIVGFVNVRY